MKNRKGFTLIELLAVIVILGLLMAIAIPSVTKYITESRKKTLTTTLGNYIGALVNDVNDLSYTFTGQNTIYAVPIECIALERGGTDPFGHWYQANDNYFAYVLIQYDDVNSKYVYGFTFKDSAGYGLYPTIQGNINEKGSQIKTGYTLNKPVTGDITSLTTLAKWQESGFKVDSSTNLQVLVATSENETGDGTSTCTLQQKGDNYAQVEASKKPAVPTLASLITTNNTIITKAPTLTTSSNKSSDTSGLYKSTATTNGSATYYFRGNVTNNYVSFAGLTWRIVRINEDGTIRLILNSGIGSGGSVFNTNGSVYDNAYYSKGGTAKTQVDNWYTRNIVDKGYDSYVALGMFCEQSKVKYNSSWTSGSAVMEVYTSYIANFDCDKDGNNKGVLNLKVGLITYDEAVHAGGYYDENNTKYYLYNGRTSMWTMSPGAFPPDVWVYVWHINLNGYLSSGPINRPIADFQPVINLNADVSATGTGISIDPYVVLTN